MGKLYVEAQGEVALCADIFDYYADRAEAILAPRDLDVREGKAHIETSPIGPIFCIEPWNFPYYQLARVAGPNLMAGNTIIMKHAPGVPQCALAFEKVLLDAGAPLGAYTNVFLTNDQAAMAIADPRVRGVALTGSERAGAAVAATAGKALKKSTMELGGSDAFIVLDDADLEIGRAAGGRRPDDEHQTGLHRLKRFIVHASIAEIFTAGFREEFEKLVPGDPLDGRTDLGPLTSRAALDHVLQQIEQGVAGGAKVVTGGRKLDRKGYFLAPTILTDVAPMNPIFHQEFFAPVAMVFAAESEEEAIKLANDFALWAGRDRDLVECRTRQEGGEPARYRDGVHQFDADIGTRTAIRRDQELRIRARALGPRHRRIRQPQARSRGLTVLLPARYIPDRAGDASDVPSGDRGRCRGACPQACRPTGLGDLHGNPPRGGRLLNTEGYCDERTLLDR